MSAATLRTSEWQPPNGPSRAAGGLLGVAGGETFAEQAYGDRTFIASLLSGREWPSSPASPSGVSGVTYLYPHAADGPVTRALVELADSYVLRRGHGVPVDVAEKHEGVPTPAWLLAVAVVRSNSRELIADTLELANAAGVPSRSLGDCVAYVELAAGLFAGRPASAAIETATRGGRRHCTAVAAATASTSSAAAASVYSASSSASSGPPGPPLCGEGPVDALTAGIWALSQPGGIADVMPALAAVTTPGVGAAAAGLLGLRDGSAGMPAHWQRRLRSAPDCLALAPGLVRARCRGHQLHRHLDTPGSPCVHGVVAGAR